MVSQSQGANSVQIPRNQFEGDIELVNARIFLLLLRLAQDVNWHRQSDERHDLAPKLLQSLLNGK